MLEKWADKVKDGSNEIANKVNGYGVYFRFILPIAITLLGWSLNANINTVKEDILEIHQAQIQVAKDLLSYQQKTDTYNTNHLEHHRLMEITISERLACIETELKRLRK